MIPKSIAVGIVSKSVMRFKFFTSYSFDGNVFVGEQEVAVRNGRLLFADKEYDTILFTPCSYDTSVFELCDVVIGIDFHWQQTENQQFRGALKLIVEDNKVTAINILEVEDYLACVIASEMRSTSSLELLKAHAVISRSWLLRPYASECFVPTQGYSVEDDVELVERWYERDGHTHFDVCADDHCQRYQGLLRADTKVVKQAVNETRGQVLMYGGTICDARFSKSCGGATERFDACWDNRTYDYLHTVADSATGELCDLSTEEAARKWILSSPESFCNTTDSEVLKQVLNSYDASTVDYYRWKVVYTQEELSQLVCRRSGIDFGTIYALEPVQRGGSGRIVYLKIVGEKRTVVVGKELEIRKWLSESHLYSSAFVVDREGDNFVLRGAGWGHGVGLCQIGAALMSHKGYDYRQILAHYYRSATVEKVY